MCRQCQQCQCQESSPSKCICFTVQIQRPYQCNCTPNQEYTNVGTSDVVEGLLKYNSNLIKYLHKYQQKSPSLNEKLDEKQSNLKNVGQQKKDKGKSIVQIYNLNILPAHLHPIQPQKDQNDQQQGQIEEHKKQMIDFQQQTSPRNKKNNIPKYPPGSNEEKLQKHFKQVAASSRYLPNSGFKKYFGRECFQNYGRMNTTGVADGIVYNNYLKTFNISPHCGGNMPITQQSYKQTLIKGDNKKYQNLKVPQTHYGNQVDRKAAQGYHKKPLSNMPQIIQQSKKNQQEQLKYSRANFNNPTKSKNQSRRNTNKNELTKNQIFTNKVVKNEQPTIRIKGPQQLINQRQTQTVNQYQYQNQIQMEEKQNEVQQMIPVIKGRQGWENNPMIDQISQIRSRQKNFTQNYQPNYQPQANQKNRNFKHNINCQRWQDDNRLSLQQRLHMKKQILNSCYNNLHAAKSVEKLQKPPCCLCLNRRFTKCCCVQ